MKKIILDRSDEIVEWVSPQIGYTKIERAIGIGLEDSGKIVAGVLFADHSDVSVMMHVASDGTKRWMTPGYLAFCFMYPFRQLWCQRITGIVREDNIAAQRFDEHLGFKREGLIRKANKDGSNAIIYGMLEEECRFIRGRYVDVYNGLMKDVNGNFGIK